jgi:hypothetical protein
MAMADAQPRRPDLSLALVHLTRERKEYEATTDLLEPRKVKSVVSAVDVLREILLSGVIRGSGNEGYVKGKQRAVCLTETPLSALHHFASPPDEEVARYRYFGIAVSKKAAFEAGGRPVIYLPDEDANWIPEEQRWRHVRYELRDTGSVDWTHEREWRVPNEFKLANVPGYYIIVWSPNEMKTLQAFNHPTKKLVRGILSMEHLRKFL